MNSEQQRTKRDLDRALIKHLESMGWKLENRVRGLLSHPKLENGTRPVPALDAWALTRADPTWSWPQRANAS